MENRAPVYVNLGKYKMAFICDWCRDNLLDNKGHLTGFITSKGSCELCDTFDVCNDVNNYNCKKDWKNILKNQIDFMRVKINAY
jgi:hypothetical protein